MRKRGIGLIIVACTLPVLLAMASLGTTRVKFWVWVKDNAYTIVNFEYQNDNGDQTAFFACTPAGGACGRMCASCHTGGQDRSKEVYTVEKHEKGHYPRMTVSLLAGQRLPYGDDGGYLTSNAGRLEFFTKDGKLSLTTPTGSSLLKDAAGRPFLLWMPGDPTLPPNPR